MYTIRLNPDAGTGSGGGSSSVSVPVSDYEALLAAKAELATLRTEQEGKLREAETERLKAITDKDELAKELDKQRATWEAREADAKRKASESEISLHRAIKARDLTDALSGVDFIDDKARAAVRTLLESRFEAKAGPDGVTTVDPKTGRPVVEAVKELLPTEYAFALKPTTTGGSGATQTRQGNGAASSAPGAVVVSQSRLNNPEYAAEMQPKIAEAYRNNTLTFIN
jgi:ribosomal protein L9